MTTAASANYKVITQGTPNPNALKFIVAKDVKTKGKVSYSHPAECLGVPLAGGLLSLLNVSQVHFFENVITVTQDGGGDWPVVEEAVIRTIQELLPAHNPDFASDESAAKSRANMSPELIQIEESLDRTIRPGLQADGGDLEVLEFADNRLIVRYEGACGSCPSSRTATLDGITGILRHEYHPDIQVEAV